MPGYALRKTLIVPAIVCAAVAPASADDALPTFSDSVEVLEAAQLLQPVDYGQAVRVRFPVGELEITAGDLAKVRTELDIGCRKLSEALCSKYRKRLRLEGEVIDGVVEVRLVGLPRWKLRKLRLEGRVSFPRWAPLELRMGVGDVEIQAGDEDVVVAMGIGDLTVRAPSSAVASVRARTGIGDATLSGETRVPTERRRLLGARVEWEDGVGSSRIALGLRIGDARVVLE